MKCPKCKENLIQRQGKFGSFWCCPKSNPNDNHGTFSTGQRVYETTWHNRSDPLMNAIERQMISMGGGMMTDLDRFVEGDYEASLDDEDHWMNGREY